MDIVCQNCMSKFKLPDEKIPADKVTALPCPKCKSKISIGPRNQTATSVQADINSSDYDASEKPFDFIEEEGSTALDDMAHHSRCHMGQHGGLQAQA